MWQGSKATFVVEEEAQRWRPSHALVIGRSRAANADAVLVAAVLAGAPTTWLWTSPTVVDVGSTDDANWVTRAPLLCDEPQRPHRKPYNRNTARRLRAIWRELARMARKFKDRWRP